MQTKPLKHLINILRTTKDHHPNFTLFLGAGASISSGIKSGGEMIKEWRESYIEMYSRDDLSKQNWFGKSNEYSELFERLYDQPTQRREYIENCIVNSYPSWGYIYLVNLLKNNILNTIFTTNFDDLINEACHAFSNNLRPVVCAHDSSIKNIRITSSRPKIVKLHGDFLFDDIKNTIRELESLEDNMRTKFRQYANEFGMIVMGYAGNDRSIMDTLNTLLHSDDCFPHGIYWCIRRGTDLDHLPDELKNLARFPRFHLIEIDGFDESMAEINHSLSLELQEEVSQPYLALSNKLNKYFTADEDENISSDLIKKDSDKLYNHVNTIDVTYQYTSKILEKIRNNLTNLDNKAFQEALANMFQEIQFLSDGHDLHLYSTPSLYLASAALSKDDFEKARFYSAKSLDSKETVEALCIFLISSMRTYNKDDIQNDIIKDIENNTNLIKNFKELSKKDQTRVISLIVELISHGYFGTAKEIIDWMRPYSSSEGITSLLDINEALACIMENIDIPSDLYARIRDNRVKQLESDQYWQLLGSEIILKSTEFFGTCLKQISEANFQSVLLQDMPIFKIVTPEQGQLVVEEGVTRGIISDDDDDDGELEQIEQ